MGGPGRTDARCLETDEVYLVRTEASQLTLSSRSLPAGDAGSGRAGVERCAQPHAGVKTAGGTSICFPAAPRFKMQDGLLEVMSLRDIAIERLPRLKADARRRKSLSDRERPGPNPSIHRPLSSRLIENVFHPCLHRRGHNGRQLLRHAGEMPGLFGECLCLFARMLRRQFNERGR